MSSVPTSKASTSRPYRRQNHMQDFACLLGSLQYSLSLLGFPPMSWKGFNGAESEICPRSSEETSTMFILCLGRWDLMYVALHTQKRPCEWYISPMVCCALLHACVQAAAHGSWLGLVLGGLLHAMAERCTNAARGCSGVGIDCLKVWVPCLAFDGTDLALGISALRPFRFSSATLSPVVNNGR